MKCDRCGRESGANLTKWYNMMVCSGCAEVYEDRQREFDGSAELMTECVQTTEVVHLVHHMEASGNQYATIAGTMVEPRRLMNE